MQEVWKDVKGYEGFYQVSNFGRVRGKDRIVRHSGTFERIQYGKILRQHKDGGGYLMVGLHRRGKTVKRKIHRLVSEAFIENSLNKPEVNHIDENKENNMATNLMWCTRLENEHWGTKTERKVANTNYAAIAQKNSKKVIQKDIQGNVLRTWNSLAQIHNTMGYSTGNISMACNGKYKRPLYGCHWEYCK